LFGTRKTVCWLAKAFVPLDLILAVLKFPSQVLNLGVEMLNYAFHNLKHFFLGNEAFQVFQRLLVAVL
jgi:hypothetical protein